MQKTSKIKVAVLGYGFLGKWHAQKVAHISKSDLRVELCAIIDPLSESLNAAKDAFASSNYPDLIFASNPQEIIDRIDAVIIATPTSLHAQLIQYFYEHKKHIFCEKPLCSSVSELRKLTDLVRSESPIIQVGHSERCHEVWSEVEKNYPIDWQNCHLKFSRLAPFKNRALDVDVTVDLMIHDIDLIHYLTHQHFLSVKATGFKTRSSHFDTVSVYAQLSSGSTVWLECSRDYVQEQRTVTIFSQQQNIFIDLASYSLQTHNHEHPQAFNKRDHLLEEQKLFYKSILDQEPVFVSLKDGGKAVSVIDAINRSLSSGDEEVVSYT